MGFYRFFSFIPTATPYAALLALEPDDVDPVKGLAGSQAPTDQSVAA